MKNNNKEYIRMLTDKTQEVVYMWLANQVKDPQHTQRRLMTLTRKLRNAIADEYMGDYNAKK